MPTITFDKLSEDKKNMIECAARKEFSNYTYDQVSINRIIQDINMPRGSFYLYFENKEDLYLHVIRKYIHFAIDKLIKRVNGCDGDIIKAYKLSLGDIIDYCNKGTHSLMVKNLLLGLTHKIGLKLSKPDKMEIINKIFNHVDRDYFIDEYKEDLFITMDLLTNILIHALTEYLVMGIPIEKIERKYYKQLTIVSRGVYKEEIEI
jgi:Transcriptional regulator